MMLYISTDRGSTECQQVSTAAGCSICDQVEQCYGVIECVTRNWHIVRGS